MKPITALAFISFAVAIKGVDQSPIKQAMPESKKAELDDIMSFAAQLNKLKAFAAAALELKKKQQ